MEPPTSRDSHQREPLSDDELRRLWGDEVYPPYVATAEERRRWDICHRLATTISEVNEPRGVANQRFVWYMERELWSSDLPTGDDEPPSESGSSDTARSGR